MSPSPVPSRTRLPPTSHLPDPLVQVIKARGCPRPSTRQTGAGGLVAMRGGLYTASPMRSRRATSMVILDEFGYYYRGGVTEMWANTLDPRALKAARDQESVLAQGGKARPRKRP